MIDENTEFNHISKKKPSYPVNWKLAGYLNKYSRQCKVPITYDEMLDFDSAYPLKDHEGNDTYWLSVLFSPFTRDDIYERLKLLYAILTSDGDTSSLEHLVVDRVDFCEFGNSKPFRVCIMNSINDNYDYYYIKKADASRVYGLELEHILSPNKMNYLYWKNTLVEEHILGVPGDQFLKRNIQNLEINYVRLSKEFVKFNERCIIRLLGDMRAYNWVVDITPDFDNIQYRIRAIDFDQQCYDGRRTIYMPQFFRDNLEYVQNVMDHISMRSVVQYQIEERSLIRRRVRNSRHKLKDLLNVMDSDIISTDDRVENLAQELSDYYKHDYTHCKTMGEILRQNLKVSLLLQ